MKIMLIIHRQGLGFQYTPNLFCKYCILCFMEIYIIYRIYTILLKMEKRFINTKEMAIYLGLSEHTIRAWVKLGRLPFSKFGGAVRFDLRVIDKWAERHANKYVKKEFHLDCEKSLI